MYDLPDYLPGCPPMYGVKQEAPKYYQGDQITIPAELQVDPSPYTLRAYLTDCLDDGKIVWAGTQTCGITTISGVVSINIKASIAQCIPSGTYFLALVGSTLHDIDTWTVLYQSVISITPAASSPYPIFNAIRSYAMQPSAARQQAVASSLKSLPWFEGSGDTPPAPPPATHTPAIYSGDNGTFFRWNVTEQKWVSIVS